MGIIRHSLPIALLVILSLGYFFDTFHADVYDTVSDQWNFIPVAIKLDHPDLYQGDLFLDNVEDVKYYTPFFISGIRFFTMFTNDNYIAGLNLFNLLINIVFSLGWYFFFFKIFRKTSFALLFSLIIRGLMWLPGYEIWGAGPLWTALPRTAFIALLPFALILFLPEFKNRYAKPIGYFLLGLIANFHPLSGLGIIVALFMADFTVEWSLKRIFSQINFKSYLLYILLVVIGIAPYVFIYYKYVISQPSSNPELFNSMLPLRIGDMFTEPMNVLKKFSELKWIVFLLLPYGLIAFINKKISNEDRFIVRFYLLFSLFIILFSILVIPVENLLRSAGIDIHMAFQLVRNIKYIVVPVFLFYGYFIFFILKLNVNTIYAKYKLSALLIGFILLLLFSRYEPLRSVPLVGDDFIRTTMPNVYSFKKELVPKDTSLLKTMEWINQTFDQQVKFIGPSEIRVQCRQSVIHDGKGSSMLIEGNPDKFNEWGMRSLALKKCQNPNEKLKLYKSWDAEFLLTKDVFENENIIYRNGTWKIYKIRIDEGS